MKKAFLGCSIILAISVSLIAFGFNKLGEGLCSNEVEQTAVSPDGRVKAVVFERDCGATTGFSTQISIVGNGSGLPNSVGNVFIAAGNDGEVGSDGKALICVKWVGARQLQILYPQQSVVHQERGHVLIGLGFLQSAFVNVSYLKTAAH